MKKNILIAAFFLGILCSSNGQNNHRKYYKNINRAELAYNAHQFKKSADYYERAFNRMSPFSRDINTYLLLYSYHHCGKEAVALKYAHALAQRDDLWPKLYIGDTVFQNKLNIIKDTTMVLVNPILKQAIDSLRTRDQQVRKSCLNSDEMNRLVAVIDSANMKDLLDLFQQYGFVNECNGGNLAVLTIELIFLHNSKTRNIDLPFHILEDAVRQGTYDARSFMHLYDDCMTWRSESGQPVNTGYGTGFEHYMAYANTLFIYPPDDVRKINENRASLGIDETWCDFEKKLVETFMNCGAGFVMMNTAVGGGGTEEKEASKIIAEIDSGQINGKYVIREIDCDGLFSWQ